MIYFRGAEEAKSLVELIQIGYTAGNGKCVRTYNDPELLDCQCQEARRSLDDLLVIANTYFPNSTEADVLTAINETKFEGRVFVIFYCSDIKKPVFQIFRLKDLGGYGYRKVGNIYYYDYSMDDQVNSDYSVNMIKEMIQDLSVEA